MPIQPPYDFGEETLGIRFEFKRMVRPRIGDDILVRGGDLLEKTLCPVVSDDPILARKQQESRNGHMAWRGTHVAVEAYAIKKETRRGLVQCQRIGADKLAPLGRGGEKVGVVEWNGEQTCRGHETGGQNA